jgi:hypothetical protein
MRRSSWTPSSFLIIGELKPSSRCARALTEDSERSNGIAISKGEAFASTS